MVLVHSMPTSCWASSCFSLSMMLSAPTRFLRMGTPERGDQLFLSCDDIAVRSSHSSISSEL
jgi:hypothetical protein